MSTTDGRGQRLLLWSSGLLGIAVGVSLMYRARLGVGPFDVAATGLASTTGVPAWAGVWAITATFALGAVALGQRLRPATLVAAVAIGPAFGVALAIGPTPTTPVARALVLGVGIAITGAGAAAQIASDLGPAPAELFTVALAARLRRGLRPTRTTIEVSMLVVGAVVGGQLGWGTLAVAVGFPVCLAVTHRLLRPAGPDAPGAVRPAALTA